jgi:hypothetical protein
MREDSSVNWKIRRRLLARANEQGKPRVAATARLDCGRKRRARKGQAKSRRYGRGHGLWLASDIDQRIRRRLARDQPQRAIARAERVSFRSVQRRRRRMLQQQARGLEGLTPLPCAKWRCSCGLVLVVSVCVRCQRARPVPENVQSQRPPGRR